MTVTDNGVGLPGRLRPGLDHQPGPADRPHARADRAGWPPWRSRRGPAAAPGCWSNCRWASLTGTEPALPGLARGGVAQGGGYHGDRARCRAWRCASPCHPGSRVRLAGCSPSDPSCLPRPQARQVSPSLLSPSGAATKPGLSVPDRPGCRRPMPTPLARAATLVRRFSARRSSSLSPPQTPASWPLSSAHCRHGSMTLQRWQTCLASSIWVTAGPVFPIGKEQLRVHVTAGGVVTPVHEVHSSGEVQVPDRALRRSVVLVNDFTSFAICRLRCTLWRNLAVVPTRLTLCLRTPGAG